MAPDASEVSATSAFGDALDAASRARARGGSDEQLRSQLSAAARAGAAIFEASRAPRSTVIDLDAGVANERVDTSARNPWTYVRAAYAALASGDDEAQRRLAAASPIGHTDQVTTSPVLDAVAARLHAILGGHTTTREARDDTGDTYWRAQLDALDALGDANAFEAALAQVEEREREHYGSGTPERALMLPVLGLRALSHDFAAPGSRPTRPD